MSNNPWVQSLVSTVVGALLALLSAWAAAFFQKAASKRAYFAQRQMRAEELWLSRIEDLYAFFVKWETQFTAIYLLHLHYIGGKISWANVCEEAKKAVEVNPVDARRWQILVALHFPEFEERLTKVESARSGVAKFFVQSGVGDPAVLAEFIASQKIFERSAGEFKAAIGDLCRRSGVLSRSAS